MILLKARLRRIMQMNHMPCPVRNKILTNLDLREQATSLRLRTACAITARCRPTENVIAVARDDIHRRR